MISHIILSERLYFPEFVYLCYPPQQISNYFMKKSSINTIIGIVVIFGIIIGYSVLTRPSKEELARKRKEDSVRVAAEKKRKVDSVITVKKQRTADSLKSVQAIIDSLKAREQRAKDSPDNSGK